MVEVRNRMRVLGASALAAAVLSSCSSAKTSGASGASGNASDAGGATSDGGGASASEAGGTSDAADSKFAVPGYQVGEIPHIPSFTIPNVGVLTNSADSFAIDTTVDIASVPGIRVEKAVCGNDNSFIGGFRG